jgi:glucose-1-phosphate cytidylyltransferase
VKLKTGEIVTHDKDGEDWTIHLLDTGAETQTGGRIKRVANFIGDEAFMLTYGDGVCNVSIPDLLDFHQSHGKMATLTAVRPPARFGQMLFEDDRVKQFEEKPQIGEGWINGGFFVLEPQIANYIDGDQTIWEREPLERLSTEGQLLAYRHADFWQCMDTLRDVNQLDRMWQEGRAPWKIW